MDNRAKALAEELFVDGASTFAALDGASVPGLLDKFDECKPEFVCLYRGELKPDLAEVAPYLVRLEPGTKMTNWILSEGWGNHWGIFAISVADLPTMRQHFRRFLTVYDEKGKPLLFRFYDPRVLGAYLPTCNADELKRIFGPVQEYVVEGENPTRILTFKAGSGEAEERELISTVGPSFR